MQYDAIIMGGSPSGLALASELSRTRRVLLDELVQPCTHCGDKPQGGMHNPGFDFA